ncbi:MAG TPA: hypothetical protein VFY06_01210 [Verrucomicrobiae bacterium]|nr:hypothetical protein [Verrucomicrobiae bacterium]
MKIYVLVDNQPRGPYSPEFVRQMLNRGRLLPTNVGAYEGGTDWKPLSELIPSWDTGSPKRSRVGVVAASVAGVLALLAAAGGYVWWHAHHGTSGKLTALPKAIASAKAHASAPTLPVATAAQSQATASSGVSANPVSTSAESARPTRETLAGKTFRFSWKTDKGGGNYRPLVFHPDGTLGGGTGSPNETFWAIDGQGRLVFKHRNGRVSTIFTRAEQRDGKWFFSGPYQFSSGVEHSLVEIGPATAGNSGAAPAAQPDAATRLKDLKALYDQGLIPQDIYDQKRKEILDSL